MILDELTGLECDAVFGQTAWHLIKVSIKESIRTLVGKLKLREGK